MAQRDGRVVEDRRQLFLQLRASQLDRRRLGRLRKHGERGRVELDAAGRLRRRHGIAFDLDDGLGKEVADCVVLHDDLREPARVAEHNEGDATELAPLLEPSGEPDAPADVGGQLVREDALHGGHLLAFAWRCGREALPRCHRTSPPSGGLVGPGDGGRPAGSSKPGGGSSRGSGVSAPSSPVA